MRIFDTQRYHICQKYHTVVKIFCEKQLSSAMSYPLHTTVYALTLFLSLITQFLIAISDHILTDKRIFIKKNYRKQKKLYYKSLMEKKKPKRHE